MDYSKKKSDYSDEDRKEKYYSDEKSKEETQKENHSQMPTFGEVFEDVPKGGSISAMPELHNGIVYLPSIDTHVYAINAASGQMIWKFKTGEPVLSTPLVHNGQIYFGSNNGYFYCLDMDGKLKWKKQLGGVIVSYPTAVGEKIFIAAGKTFFCLSEDGKEEWKFVTGGGMIVVPTFVNGLVFIGSYDGHAYALDMGGRLKWKFTAGRPISSPIIFSDNKALFTMAKRSWDKMPEARSPVLYFPSFDNNLYAVDQEGQILWKFNCGTSIPGGISGGDGVIYCGTISGLLYAIDASTGYKKWSFKTGGMITGGVALQDDMIYAVSWNQKLYCLSLQGEKIWDFLTGGPIVADPVTAKDKIYFGSEDTRLYCLNTKNRTVEWTFQCGSGMPKLLKDKVRELTNAFVEYDRKVFKVWTPETITKNSPISTVDYGSRLGLDKTFSYGGSGIYSSTSYLDKKKKDKYHG